jgi:hypothetical protein
MSLLNSSDDTNSSLTNFIILRNINTTVCRIQTVEDNCILKEGGMLRDWLIKYVKLGTMLTSPPPVTSHTLALFLWHTSATFSLSLQ